MVGEIRMERSGTSSQTERNWSDSANWAFETEGPRGKTLRKRSVRVSGQKLII